MCGGPPAARLAEAGRSLPPGEENFMSRNFRLAAADGLAITVVAVAPGTGYAATQAARHTLGQAGAAVGR
jgi:hypothetical protein